MYHFYCTFKRRALCVFLQTLESKVGKDVTSPQHSPGLSWGGSSKRGRSQVMSCRCIFAPVIFGVTFGICTIGGRLVAVDNVDAFLGVHLTDAAVVVSNALEATWREWDAVLQASFWNPPSFDTRWCSFRGILVESYISLCRLQLSLWNPPSPNVRCSFGGILEESKISQESKFRISSLAHFQVFSSSPLLAGRQKNIMASTSCKKSSIFAAGEVTLLRHITILSSARVTIISTKVIILISPITRPPHTCSKVGIWSKFQFSVGMPWWWWDIWAPMYCDVRFCCSLYNCNVTCGTDRTQFNTSLYLIMILQHVVDTMCHDTAKCNVMMWHVRGIMRPPCSNATTSKALLRALTGSCGATSWRLFGLGICICVPIFQTWSCFAFGSLPELPE